MAYLTGSIEAVDFYCAAFNAEKTCFKAADDDDFYAHAEIIINGRTVMAICDIKYCEMVCKREFTRGDNMEFWMTFGNEQSLNTAYDVLKEKAQIHTPLAPCEWSGQMAQLTDKYGISWLLYQ
jgi:uncharacterized glyoxalase superfamily protein PhnB